MSTQDAEPMLAGNPRRWNQATGPISATICSVLEAGWKPSSPGFWQSLDGSATLDGALFNRAQIIDSFSSDMEMQTWKAAARHSASSGLEKGIITDFAKKARSQLIKEGSFTAARALDFLVCEAINEPHLLADGSIPNQFLCARCDQKVLATRKHELWECPGNTLINHTHRGAGRCARVLQTRQSFQQQFASHQDFRQRRAQNNLLEPAKHRPLQNHQKKSAETGDLCVNRRRFRVLQMPSCSSVV